LKGCVHVAATLHVDHVLFSSSKEFISDDLHDLPSLEDLGVEPRAFETMARYLLRVRKFQRCYEEHVGEFALPELPKKYKAQKELYIGKFKSA
jgi:hypothetical protein